MSAKTSLHRHLTQSHGPAPQRGVAALILVAMLGLAMGLLVIGYANDTRQQTASDQQTILALARAREALLGYAATYRETHPNPPGSSVFTEVFGYLPCPDTGNVTGEGTAGSGCGSKDVTVIGRLPWRTLDLPPLRDGSGECLWYAVSGNFKNGTKTDLMNRDTNGLIEVMAADGTNFLAGSLPTQRAVAVIFAPGAILPGQDRALAASNSPTVCGGNYNPANYLDADVVSGINNAAGASTTANALSRFIATESSDKTVATNDAFNDQLAVITPAEIFAQRLDKRADFEGYLTDPLTGTLRLAAECVAEYGRQNQFSSDKRLPWAAPLDLSIYGTASYYDDIANRYSGRLPYTVRDSGNDTNNKVFGHWPAYKPLLGSDCPSSGGLNWQDRDEFWNNWKDHIFYAVAEGFGPNGLAGSGVDPCAFGQECLKVVDRDGSKSGMAAVLIFAGARQAGQNRNNNATPIGSYVSTAKADPANYLEAINVTSIQKNSSLSAGSPRLFSKRKSDGNDTVMCIVRGSSWPYDLYVDPTCGRSSTCTADGSSLAGYRSGATNTCKSGSSGITSACQTLVERIDENNCPGTNPTGANPPLSCEAAARKFVSADCLDGFATPKCQIAHSTLLGCS